MIHPERRRENIKKIEEMDKRDAEPLQPDWKSKCMNTKVDMVEVVRCKDCKHWYFADNRIPSEQENVCGRNGIVVTPNWFCADGEREEGR